LAVRAACGALSGRTSGAFMSTRQRAQSTLGESCTLPDSLRLPKMTAVVRGDNQQPRADRGAEESDGWGVEANSVQIKSGPVSNYRSHILVGAKKSLQGLPPGDPRSRHNFLWRAKFSSGWRLE